MTNGIIGIENKAFTFPGENKLLSKIDNGAIEAALVGDFAERTFTSSRILTKIFLPFQLETDSVERARIFLEGILSVAEPVPNPVELRILLQSLEDRLSELLPEETEEISC
jgi:hypothetical protein